MIYKELKKRNLISNKKEFNEMIWLRQIKVDGKIIRSSKDEPKKIKSISIGHFSFDIG